MGWFSADEIIAPTTSVAQKSEGHHTAQTIALCSLAVAAVGYILFRGFAKIQRQQTEQAARRAAAQV